MRSTTFFSAWVIKVNTLNGQRFTLWWRTMMTTMHSHKIIIQYTDTHKNNKEKSKNLSYMKLKSQNDSKWKRLLQIVHFGFITFFILLSISLLPFSPLPLAYSLNHLSSLLRLPLSFSCHSHILNNEHTLFDRSFTVISNQSLQWITKCTIQGTLCIIIIHNHSHNIRTRPRINQMSLLLRSR